MTTITENAAIRRINRRLRQRCERLSKVRGEKAQISVGACYVVQSDASNDILNKLNLPDVEQLGRELGAIRGCETIEVEEQPAPRARTIPIEREEQPAPRARTFHVEVEENRPRRRSVRHTITD